MPSNQKTNNINILLNHYTIGSNCRHKCAQTSYRRLRRRRWTTQHPARTRRRLWTPRRQVGDSRDGMPGLRGRGTEGSGPKRCRSGMSPGALRLQPLHTSSYGRVAQLLPQMARRRLGCAWARAPLAPGPSPLRRYRYPPGTRACRRYPTRASHFRGGQWLRTRFVLLTRGRLEGRPLPCESAKEAEPDRRGLRSRDASPLLYLPVRTRRKRTAAVRTLIDSRTRTRLISAVA